jgi:uncharacterized protein (DUF362 family)
MPKHHHGPGPGPGHRPTPPLPVSAVINYLRGHGGERILVETEAGSVTGILIRLGVDTVVLREDTGDIVLIPAIKVNAVSFVEE